MSWSLKSVCMAGCVLALSALAASPAGAFERSQEIWLHKWDNAETASFDRNGNIFLSVRRRIPNAAFNTIDAEKVIKLSPHGKRLGTIDATFVRGGDVYYIIGHGTVTPNGATVVMAGGATHDGTDPQPLVAKFSATTGHLIEAVAVDPSVNDYIGAVAVDPTGQHIYVVDFVDGATSLPDCILELNVSLTERSTVFRSSPVQVAIGLRPSARLRSAGPKATSTSRSTSSERQAGRSGLSARRHVHPTVQGRQRLRRRGQRPRLRLHRRPRRPRRTRP